MGLVYITQDIKEMLLINCFDFNFYLLALVLHDDEAQTLSWDTPCFSM